MTASASNESASSRCARGRKEGSAGVVFLGRRQPVRRPRFANDRCAGDPACFVCQGPPARNPGRNRPQCNVTASVEGAAVSGQARIEQSVGNLRACCTRNFQPAMVSPVPPGLSTWSLRRCEPKACPSPACAVRGTAAKGEQGHHRRHGSRWTLLSPPSLVRVSFCSPIAGFELTQSSPAKRFYPRSGPLYPFVAIPPLRGMECSLSATSHQLRHASRQSPRRWCFRCKVPIAP